MPSSHIETTGGWIAGRHAELIDAIQRAMIEGTRIPQGDRAIRILEFPHEAFSVPHGHGPRYTVSGRSLEAKRRLYASLAREFAAFGVPPADLMIIVHDVARENWGLRGEAASDVEMAFDINV